MANQQKSTKTNFRSFLLLLGKIISLMALFFLFLSNYTRIFDVKVDMSGDNAYYYSLGKSISEGKGFTSTIGFEEAPHTHFPPGYPWFIALIMKMGGDSIKAVKIANGVLLGLSMILFFLLLNMMCKNFLLSFTATALFVSQYFILRFSTMIMSEPLFIFFTLVCMLIILILEKQTSLFSPEKRWKNIILLTILFLCLFYIYFIRTMALSFIFAVIIYYFIRTVEKTVAFFRIKNKEEDAEILMQKKRGILSSGIVLLLVIIAFIIPKTAWDARNKSINKTGDAYVGAFYMKLDGETMETFADWKERILKNTKTYITEWIPTAIFSQTPDTNREINAIDWVKGIGILLLMLFGVFRLPRGSLLLFLYIAITMAVLLIWPEQYSGHRYMIPIIPFLIFLFIYGIYALLKLIISLFWKPQKDNYLQIALSALVCIVFVIIAQPSYAASIQQQEKEARFKEYNEKNSSPALAEFIEAMKWVDANLPETARVTTRKPELYNLYTGRKSCMFVRYGTPEEVLEFFINYNLDYVIIDHWFRHGYTTIIPAVQAYPEKFKVIHQIGPRQEGEPATYVIEFNPNWGYTGEMKDGKREGQGKLVMQNGLTYKGAFKEGEASGYGELIDTAGNVLSKGIWERGSLVRPQ